jgi:hypothetical protein
LLNCEVQLNPDVFQWLVKQGPIRPQVDLFASNVNTQLPRFYSWKPDSAAEGTDAFDFCWNHACGYAYPPFVLIPRVLRKIYEDKAVVILIHPDWPGALWAPDLLWLTTHSVPLPVTADLLRYPNCPGLRHPMKDLRLIASWLDGGSRMYSSMAHGLVFVSTFHEEEL